MADAARTWSRGTARFASMVGSDLTPEAILSARRVAAQRWGEHLHLPTLVLASGEHYQDALDLQGTAVVSEAREVEGMPDGWAIFWP